MGIGILEAVLDSRPDFSLGLNMFCVSASCHRMISLKANLLLSGV